MNDTHPSFDLAMELLCILPHQVRPADRVAVASDLCVEVEELPALFRVLDRRKIRLARRHASVAIAGCSWVRAREIGDAYEALVNGDDQRVEMKL